MHDVDGDRAAHDKRPVRVPETKRPDVDRPRSVQRNAGNQAMTRLLADPSAEQAVLGPGTGGQVRQLQSTAGNATVSGLLKRPTVQRSILGPSLDFQARFGDDPGIDWTKFKAALDGNIRKSLEGMAKTNLTFASTYFGQAIDRVKASKAAESKQRAEWTALVIDVATGFLIPSLGKAASTAAMNHLQDAERAAIARTELELAAFARTVEGTQRRTGQANTQWMADIRKMFEREDALKSLEPTVASVFSTDNMKATFTGAVKTANQALKSNATALFGEKATDVYLQKVRAAVQGQLQAMALSVDANAYTDPQLIALIGSYSKDVANEDDFAVQLEKLATRFEQEVLAETNPAVSGLGPLIGGGTQRKGHVRLENVYGAPERFALVTITEYSSLFTGHSKSMVFEQWISPEFEAIIRAKNPPTVASTELGHLPPPKTTSRELVRISAFAGKPAALALVDHESGDGEKYTFVRWVDPAMEEASKVTNVKEIPPTWLTAMPSR